MAQLNIAIGDRTYAISCQDGEEDHLRKLAAMVDDKAKASGDSAGLTETRMLLFSSLLLADELHNLQLEKSAAASTPESWQSEIDENSLIALEKLADRAEQLASTLEERGTTT